MTGLFKRIQYFLEENSGVDTKIKDEGSVRC
jgi:hypothetical protein